VATIVQCASVVLLALVSAACVSPDAEGRGERHFTGSVWTSALVQQTEHPAQWVPELALLVATPLLVNSDESLTREMSQSDAITGGKQSTGDAVAVGMSVVAGGIALEQVIAGDEARSIEVLTESIVATEGMTQILKSTTQRKRPDGTGHSSFPSGHASYAFAVATYIARTASDMGTDLGYLAYAPAAFVGINRIEANRHFPSDVTFGAFLGVLFTNVIYDAHYGEGERRGIYGSSPHVVWALEPLLEPGEVGIALACHF
jgi:hypothetical protein